MAIYNYYTEYKMLRRYYILICNSFLNENEKNKFLTHLNNLDEVLSRKRNHYDYRKRNSHLFKNGIIVKKFEPKMLTWD